MINYQKINLYAIEICKTLNAKGFQSYLVGGCVRDLLLNKIPKDWDIATNATPAQIIEIFPKNYPTGLQHGTVTVAMGHGTQNHFEVTTFRVESDYQDGRRPNEVLFVMNIEQDLSRRDFTINAMAYDPISGKLIDPFHGQKDLNNKIIKCVGDPNVRFQEDGLRIMRAVRFSSKLDFNIDDLTFESLLFNINKLKIISKERIKDELCKIVLSNNPYLGIKILHKIGALSIISPHLNEEPNHLDYLPNLNKCKSILETRLALLYANCDAIKAKQDIFNLKFSSKELKRICFLLDLLQRFHIFKEKNSNLAYKSFMALIKNHSPDPFLYTLEQFIELTEAMHLGSKSLFDKYKDEVVFSKTELQINGNDLLIIGFLPGPQIKNVLDKCYLEILRCPEHNNKDYLMKYCVE